MKRILLWLALVPAACPARAQRPDTLANPYRRAANARNETLYYVPATGAVETRTGVLILGPGLGMFPADENVPEVELPPTFFDLIDTSARRPSTGMRFFYSLCTFDARGRLLYHPFWFDNGPDYWVEGRRRFVEGDKMGLVNRLGQRVVPAGPYTFISPVRGGYAIGCRDCRYTVFDSTDTEHGTGYTGSRYEVLDAAGTVVRPLDADDPDRHLDRLHLKRRYKNPATVARLQRLLALLPETAEAAATLQLSADSCQYVCYDEPTPGTPWYHFGLEDTVGVDAGPLVQFLVSPDGKRIEHLNRGLDRQTPYALWRRQPGKWAP